MAGDYMLFQRRYPSLTCDVDLTTFDTGKAGIVPVKNANYQIYVQRITYAPATVAAVAIVFKDSAGTAIGTVPASQAVPLPLDFGPTGRALAIGTNLDLVAANGPAGAIHIEAYQRLGQTISSNSGAALQ